MDYQIIINKTPMMAGNIISLIVILIFFLLLVIYTTHLIWKKLRAYETMKYEFVAIIAHKFRTPLTQIKWILETIIDSEKDPFIKENLVNLGQSNAILINQTNTLVELTDFKNKVLATYNFEKVNLCDMVTKVTESLKERFHERNLFLEVSSSDPEIMVNVDPMRIEFVLQTIMENSINYSPIGRKVKVYLSKGRRKVSLSVIDDGIGITAADMSRLFSKFFRAENAKVMDTEGFGVGLFLVNSIVRRHSGKIKAFSEGKDKGTTFTITLPLAR